MSDCRLVQLGDFLRVLMVTPGFHPIKGGTETVVRNLSIELNKMGVHTDVMTFNMERKWNPRWRGKIEKIDGINVFKIPALDWLPIGHSPRINFGVNLLPGRFTNILERYDVIHFHELDFSFPLFSFFVRKPKIFHLHGIDIEFLKRYQLNRIVLKHVADLYISITRQMERDLAELGIPQNRIIYLPNAVDTESFHPQGEKEDNLLLYLGRILPIKGLHVLLRSLRYLKKPVRLVIVGSSVWSREYYQRVLKLIERENRKGIHEISYLGTLSQAEIIKLYQKASIFILPSFWEAFPVVTLEALSCQTPVIATPVGGIPEVVRNFENGILVPVGNTLKLAEAIQYLLDNNNIRIKFGHVGREWVTKNFSVGVIAKRLSNIYKEMISR